MKDIKKASLRALREMKADGDQRAIAELTRREREGLLLPLWQEVLITVAIYDLNKERCTVRDVVKIITDYRPYQVKDTVSNLVKLGRLRSKTGRAGGITCTGRM